MVDQKRTRSSLDIDETRFGAELRDVMNAQFCACLKRTASRQERLPRELFRLAELEDVPLAQAAGRSGLALPDAWEILGKTRRDIAVLVALGLCRPRQATTAKPAATPPAAVRKTYGTRIGLPVRQVPTGGHNNDPPTAASISLIGPSLASKVPTGSRFKRNYPIPTVQSRRPSSAGTNEFRGRGTVTRKGCQKTRRTTYLGDSAVIFNGLLVAAWLTRGTGIVTKGQPKLVAVMPDAVTGKDVKGNIYGIVRARLARATMGNIRQNLFFALIYNATGVLIAAGILYPFLGILIGPIFAAFAISVSPLSVVLNALRLRTAMV